MKQYLLAYLKIKFDSWNKFLSYFGIVDEISFVKQLKDFLRTVISNAEEELYHDSTLFICNKWETVPDKYKEEVRIDTMRKLQKFFSNITEDQLFFMSVGEVKIKRKKLSFSFPASSQNIFKCSIYCMQDYFRPV